MQLPIRILGILVHYRLLDAQRIAQVTQQTSVPRQPQEQSYGKVAQPLALGPLLLLVLRMTQSPTPKSRMLQHQIASLDVTPQGPEISRSLPFQLPLTSLDQQLKEISSTVTQPSGRVLVQVPVGIFSRHRGLVQTPFGQLKPILPPGKPSPIQQGTLPRLLVHGQSILGIFRALSMPCSGRSC